MSAKRPGWRAAERTYKHLTRELYAKAHLETLRNAREALTECLLEIRSFHSTAYPKCEGGCPAHLAMQKAEHFLKLHGGPVGSLAWAVGP